MPNSEKRNYHTYKNFEEACSDILQLMSKYIPVNTLFVAKNDKQTNMIVKSLNKKDALLETGSSLPFEETYCKRSVENGREVLFIPDLAQSELTKKLNVTANLGGGSFIGLPIYYEDGEVYGTLCGLDKESIEFTEEHEEFFITMASILTYVLELDNANRQIEDLSAQLVPVTSQISILPIIGDFNEQRAEGMISSILTKIQQQDWDYIIVDLSGIATINNLVSNQLLKLIETLSLVGISPVITGMRPELAQKAAEFNNNFNSIKKYGNVENALKYLGFTLQQKEV